MYFIVASSRPFNLGFYTASAALTTAATTIPNGFHLDYTQVGNFIREIITNPKLIILASLLNPRF